MVYSLDFKFVLGYNDRFSGCVDNSYRRYTIFDFEERFIFARTQLVVFVFDFLCFPSFQVEHRHRVVVAPGTTLLNNENISVAFVFKQILCLAIQTVDFCAIEFIGTVVVFDTRR